MSLTLRDKNIHQFFDKNKQSTVITSPHRVKLSFISKKLFFHGYKQQTRTLESQRLNIFDSDELTSFLAKLYCPTDITVFHFNDLQSLLNAFSKHEEHYIINWTSIIEWSANRNANGVILAYSDDHICYSQGYFDMHKLDLRS